MAHERGMHMQMASESGGRIRESGCLAALLVLMIPLAGTAGPVETGVPTVMQSTTGTGSDVDPDDPFEPCESDGPIDTEKPCDPTRGGAGRYVWHEFSDRIDASQTVAAQGPELFGDQVNLMDGGLSFHATDVSLPGNNALPVAFGRSLRVENRYQRINDSPLADWHLDLPHIGGTFGLEWHGSTPGQPLNRCSVSSPVYARPPGGGRDVWNGHHLHLPGGGGGELLLVNADSRLPSSGGPWRWTAGDFVAVSCLSSIQNGSGEGFLALTADGTRYWFDWMARFHEPAIRTGPGGGVVFERSRIALYVTRVEDRFGHSVEYTYTNTWDQPIRPTRIEASDGRLLTIGYHAGTGRIATVSDGARAWHYEYAAVPGTSQHSLSAVVLPDTSRWTLALTDFSLAVIDYPLPNTDPMLEPTRTCTQLAQPYTDPQRIGTVTHPSGAVGQFTVAVTEHGRSRVPIDCQNVDQPPIPNVPDDDVNHWTISYHAWSLTNKQVTGPGLTTMQWHYSYQPTISFHYYPGSSPANPICFIADCSVPPCQDEACAGHTQTTVTGPDGDWLRYRYGNTYRYNEGKLLQVDSGTGPSGILRTLTHAYDLSQTAQAYPPSYGLSPRHAGDGFTAEYHRPQTGTQTQQQGVTFSRQVNQFDGYARPTRVTRSSTLDFSKVESTTYHDHLTKWILGQIASVRDGTSGPIIERTTYEATNALPTHRYQFEKLMERRSYHTSGAQAGLPHEIYDGSNVKRTRLNNYHRGIPRQVIFHDNTSQSAVVNDRGEITSVSNELGHTTAYLYDAMSRLSRITWPTGDSPAWTPTTLDFVQVGSAEYGIPAGHWRLTEATGAHRKITYFDGLWQPVLTREYDTAAEAATRRFTVWRYNHRGQTSFQSYPVDAVSTIGAITQGQRTIHDSLGRVTRQEQDSELGVLATQIAYQPNFVRQITNPRGFATTYSFQAYDEPTEDWIIAITKPELSRVGFTRDPWGKVTRMRQWGTYQGNTIEFVRNYVYDSHQRLCKITSPESAATFYEYDGSNNLLWTASGQANRDLICNRSTAPPSARIQHGYDARNRLTSVTYGDGIQNRTYTYEADGALHTAAAGAVTWTYSYNRRRLLTNEVFTWNAITTPFSYAYTALGHRSQMTYPSGHAVALAPNALGQPTQVGTYATNVSYHPNGAVKGFTYGNGVTHSTTQNARKLPLRLRDVQGGSVPVDLQYSYDRNGNIEDILDLTPGGVQDRGMSYDGLDRLTVAVAPDLWGTASYAYDPLDNLRSAQVGSRDYRYNYATGSFRLGSIRTPAGSLVWSFDYDARGHQTIKGGQTHTFDGGDRLRSVSGAGGGTYDYDAHGRRARRVHGHSTYYAYDREGILRFENEHSVERRLHFHLGGRLIATRHIPASGSAFVRYHHVDGQGSPMLTTSATGAPLTATQHEPYGEGWNRTVDGVGYTGHVMDGGSGLTYMQQRYYDPVVGRFISPDPVLPSTSDGGNFNRYAYANNNPYTFVDPDGRQAGTPYGDIMPWSDSYTSHWGSGVRDGGVLADFTPIGDLKAIVEAFANPTAANIVAAVIGLAGPLGDAAAKGIKGIDGTISMEKAIDAGIAHVGSDASASITKAGNVQFSSTTIDAAGNTVTKNARFDVNPSSGHVQKQGPHLNLETQVNGVKTGVDPHTPIKPETIRRGDYR